MACLMVSHLTSGPWALSSFLYVMPLLGGRVSQVLQVYCGYLPALPSKPVGCRAAGLLCLSNSAELSEAETPAESLAGLPQRACWRGLQFHITVSK